MANNDKTGYGFHHFYVYEWNVGVPVRGDFTIHCSMTLARQKTLYTDTTSDMTLQTDRIH